MSKKADTLLAELEKELQKHKLQKEPPKNLAVIPTGFEAFDHQILGVGGIPMGRITQLYGPMSCGKTLTALRLIAMAQKEHPDKVVAYIDTEFTFDEEWARQNGVDLDRLFYKRSNRLEEVFEYIVRIAESGKVSLIVLDSLGNLIPESSLDSKEAYKKDKSGEYTYREQPGVVAKKVTLFMRQIVPLIHANDIAFLVCNQIRMRIGVMYGDPTDFPGGECFRHNLSMSIKLRYVEPVQEYGEVAGASIGAKVVKNKQFKLMATDDATHLRYYFEDGINKTKIYSLYDRAVRLGVIEQSGPWYKLKDGDTDIESIQGREGVVQRIMEDEEFRETIAGLCARAEAGTLYAPSLAEPPGS